MKVNLLQTGIHSLLDLLHSTSVLSDRIFLIAVQGLHHVFMLLFHCSQLATELISLLRCLIGVGGRARCRANHIPQPGANAIHGLIAASILLALLVSLLVYATGRLLSLRGGTRRESNSCQLCRPFFRHGVCAMADGYHRERRAVKLRACFLVGVLLSR